MKKRLGCIKVASLPYEDLVGPIAEALAEIKFFPTRVEYIYYKNLFEMYGFSEQFEPVQEGMVAPNYEVIMQKDEDGNVSVLELKRVED